MSLTNEPLQGSGTMVATTGRDDAQPFEAEHPHYQKMNAKNRWIRYRAVLDGLEDQRDLEAFLPIAPFELKHFYKHRISVSVFLGVSGFAIDRLIGAVFASDPTFETGSAEVEEWIEDTDGDGTTYRELMESVSSEANAMGVCFLAAHKPKVEIFDSEGNLVDEPSREQEREAGGRKAIAEIIKAENVINWGFSDDDGSLSFVVVREVVTRQPDPSSGRILVQVFRVFTRTEVQVWERELSDDFSPKQGDSGVLRMTEDSIVHGLGRLMIEPFYGRRVQRMKGASYIRDSSRADLAKLHEDSWGVQTRSVHANPILAIKSSSELKEIFIGGNALRLDPNQEEEAAYVPIDTGPMDVRERASERFLREATLQTGSNPSMTSDGLTHNGESGRGQAIRFSQTEKRYIQAHTRALQSSASRFMDLVEMILEDKSIREIALGDGVNVARFYNSFEVWETGTLATAYNTVGASIDSETFHIAIQTKLALDMVGDAAPETRKKIQDEIAASAPNEDEDDEFGGESDSEET